jgi:hypothetical protein
VQTICGRVNTTINRRRFFCLLDDIKTTCYREYISGCLLQKGSATHLVMLAMSPRRVMSVTTLLYVLRQAMFFLSDQLSLVLLLALERNMILLYVRE